MTHRVFGIRHHGPGSARSLRLALEAMAPDLLLIEGPPEGEALLGFAADPAMKPPVALLAYEPEEPSSCSFFPFAEFSPEWQAIRFALARGLPARFMDLPQTHALAIRAEELKKIAKGLEEASGEGEGTEDGGGGGDGSVWEDPLNWLARAAGHDDGELWWERMVELRMDATGVFEAIAEAMTALREDLGGKIPAALAEREARREAHMRQTLRAAEKEGFSNIAIVCGAWHVPAFADLSGAKGDAALLKGLPKRKVAATWVPWSYGRLASASGYGAGVHSPGWYDHLWRRLELGGDSASTALIAWLTDATRLLREKDFSASPAHVVEAARLAEALAALRGRPFPALAELAESIQTVIAFGDALPLALVHRELIVGARLGETPQGVPSVPLQQDLQRLQKSLRLPPSEVERVLELDLRKETDLERSRLLHRLALLGIAWGEPAAAETRSKGTFREAWRLAWKPELAIDVIAAAIWGNTVETASGTLAARRGAESQKLGELTALIDAAILADLPAALDFLMAKLDERAAVASDVLELMRALPPLARVARYGNVRIKDTARIAHVVGGFIARVCTGLPAAASSLDDEAAEALLRLLIDVDAAIVTLEDEAHSGAWRETLARLADQEGLHGLVAGRCARLLLDAGKLDAEGVARRMGLALSRGADPLRGGAWVDGLLRGSGLALLHADRLWDLLDAWVASMSFEAFGAVLPLLRRAFSSFPPHERRQMGERVKSSMGKAAAGSPDAGAEEIDAARADLVLPILRKILVGESR